MGGQKVNKAKYSKPQNARPTIGLLIDYIATAAGEYQSTIWSGVADASQEQDVNLICFPGGLLGTGETNADLNRFRQGVLHFIPASEFEYQRNKLYDLVEMSSVDGLIISATLASQVGMEEFRNFCKRYHPLPMVSIAAKLEGIPSVLIGNKKGLRDAIVHLVETHGYRRIAFIRGPEGSSEAEERYHTYTEVLAEYGLPFEPTLIASGNFHPMAGAAAVHLLVDERKTDFEAVMAANDAMALSAMAALQERGIRTPYDVAVVGFDNIQEASVVIPSLTTVRQPIYELGQKAVELLLALWAGEKAPEQVTLPTELVVRQSCGCYGPATLRGAGVADMAMTAPDTPMAVLAEQRRHILSEVTEIVDASTARQQNVSDLSAQLLDAFIADLGDNNTHGTFLQTLDDILRRVVAAGGDVTLWHRVASLLQCHTQPYLTDQEAWLRATDLWYHTAVLIEGTAHRAQAQRRVQAAGLAWKLHNIGEVLFTMFDLTKLTELIAREVSPLFGIPGCYLSLYENSGTASEWSRLILACSAEERVDLEMGGQRFPTRQLVPLDVLSQEVRHNLLVEPLYSGVDNFGLIVFEVGSLKLDGEIYATLRSQISGALRGALLFEERKRAEKELLRSNEDLEQFAYVASHDLQEPLRMVTSYLQLIERRYKGQLDSDASEFIGYAVDGASRMKGLINDLLAYSHVSARGKPLEPINGDVVLKRVLSDLQVAIDESSATITHDPLPTVMADPMQLGQVLLNLVGNAIKFRGNKLPVIHIGVVRQGNEWLFSVCDNGIGIEPQCAKQVFAIFQRLHTREEYPGNGIGLAICKKIVEHHGGRIWLESQPGKGTAFHFTIPL